MRPTTHRFKRVGTAPALPITAAQARHQMRESLVNATNDTYIEGLIRTAVEVLEDNLAVSVVSQDWEVALTAWQEPFGLWVYPTLSIVSIQYYDEANVLQTLDSSRYWLDDTARPGVVHVKDGFPRTYERSGAIRVRFTAGMAGSADAVPAKIKHWVAITVAEMYDNRSGDVKGVAVGRLPWAETLLSSLFYYEV